jgi:hypothetical protein
MRQALLVLVFTGCSAAPVVPATPAKPAGALEIEPVSGLGLFGDERMGGQLLLASGLKDAGIADVQVLARGWELPAEGRNPLTGAQCGRPLGSYEARKRWGRALGVTGSVSSNVWCADDGGCELSVYGRPLDDEAGERFKLVAPISRDEAPLVALAAAVSRLAPPAPSPEGAGGLLLGGMGGTAPLQEDDRLEVRVFRADHRDRVKLDDAQQRGSFPGLTLGQVQACAGTDDTAQVLVEITSAGGLSHCEGDANEAVAASCLCGQLQKSAAAAWLAGKRWLVSLRVDRRDQTTSDRRLVLSGSWSTYLQRVQVPGDKYPHFKPKVEDPSIDDWTPGPARLATGCFASSFAAAGAITSRWAVWFDGVGRPTKVVEQKGFPPLQKDVAECVARALKTAQAPCPIRPGLWAMADLRISARDPNAPPPSLEDVLKGR